MTLELGPGEEDYRAGISEPVFITSSLGPVFLTLGVLERSCEPQVEAACRCLQGWAKSPRLWPRYSRGCRISFRL